MSEEAKNLEPQEDTKVGIPKPLKLWQKIFNWNLGFSILFLFNVYSQIQKADYFDGLSLKQFAWLIGFLVLSIGFGVAYGVEVGFLDKEKVEEKLKPLNNGFESLLEGVGKLIGYGIVFGIIAAIIGGLGYLVFGVLGSLSVTTLLVIIIIILLLK